MSILNPLFTRKASCKEGITISVLKAISFSRVDRCEKCLSFSNSCVRWYLTGADRQVKAGKQQPSSAWTDKSHSPVEDPAESSCGHNGTKFSCCLKYLLHHHRVHTGGWKCRGASLFLGSRRINHANTTWNFLRKGRKTRTEIGGPRRASI